MQSSPKILVEDNAVAVDLAQGPMRLPLQPLPQRYVEWIEEGRRSMYDHLQGQKNDVHFFSQHLPMLVTQTEDGVFPSNCCNKGVGFIPKAPYLAEFVDRFETVLDRTRDEPWQESLRERIRAVSTFYFDREKIDYRAMSTLEIFKRRTFENLDRTPLASLLFTGDCPRYMSFQLNCTVEIIGPDDPRHRFVLLVRNMFENDYFHITQTHFPHAYIFWISEVIDKTPFQVIPDQDGPGASPGGMPWDSEALIMISRAPGMIQEHIREQVEKYAHTKGAHEVTVELLQEAKGELM
jgi:hypothetical protein